MRAADRRDQDIGPAAYRRQDRASWNGRWSPCIRRQQQLRQRPADDIGAADHHRLHAVERGVHGLAQHEQPSGVHGTRPGKPLASRPALSGWKPSTSLAGSIAAMIFCAIDLLRQRQLHQDAVHGASALSRRSGRAARLRSRSPADAGRTTACPLRSPPWTCCEHSFAGRIVADQHHRQSRHDAAVAPQAVHGVRHLAAQVGRNHFAVDQFAVMGDC